MKSFFVVASVLLFFGFGTLCYGGIDSIFPSTYAHEPPAGIQSSFVTIGYESFNRDTMKVGETLIVKGTITNHVNRDLKGVITLFSESTEEGHRWEIVAKNPSGATLDIPGDTTTEYSIHAKPLEAGTYHIHTQLNVIQVGIGLGSGQTVTVEEKTVEDSVSETDFGYYHIVAIIILIVMGTYLVKKLKQKQ